MHVVYAYIAWVGVRPKIKTLFCIGPIGLFSGINALGGIKLILKLNLGLQKCTMRFFIIINMIIMMIIIVHMIMIHRKEHICYYSEFIKGFTFLHGDLHNKYIFITIV